MKAVSMTTGLEREADEEEEEEEDEEEEGLRWDFLVPDFFRKIESREDFFLGRMVIRI